MRSNLAFERVNFDSFISRADGLNWTFTLYSAAKDPTYSDYLKQLDHLKAVLERILPKLPSIFKGIRAAKKIEETGTETLVTTALMQGFDKDWEMVLWFESKN